MQQGVELVVTEMEAPIAEEFATVVKETKWRTKPSMGLPLDDALKSLAERVPAGRDARSGYGSDFYRDHSRNGRQLGGSVRRHRPYGSGAKESGRQNRSHDRGIGKTQGVVMCAVPPVLILTFYFLDPTLIAPLFNTVLGVMIRR